MIFVPHFVSVTFSDAVTIPVPPQFLPFQEKKNPSCLLLHVQTFIALPLALIRTHINVPVSRVFLFIHMYVYMSQVVIRM